MSFISSILGVADEAISPSLRKALTKELTDQVSTKGKDIAERVISSDVSAGALQRMADLAGRRMKSISNRSGVKQGRVMSSADNDLIGRLNLQKNVLEGLANPDVTSGMKLTNTYGGITDDSAEILNKALERTLSMRLNNEGIYGKNLSADPLAFDKSLSIRSARSARSRLLNGRTRFQKGLFADELTSEFGADSPAASMFSSFIDDGMSPLDAREAVRALLG